jgi:hypothetical protein
MTDVRVEQIFVARLDAAAPSPPISSQVTKNQWTTDLYIQLYILLVSTIHLIHP